ncbi:HAMP domain-containing protein [Geoalkalibacter halelectricus]|uniref:HAMP domain-containing protein n=1 Tax=Geoalkalibacter halelectricus TaxID=2847045 RepID=UPI003D1BDF37
MSTLKSIVSKALVPVGLTVTGFVIVCSILLYSFVKQDLIQDTIQREIQLADIIVKATRYSMLKDDRESLRQIINDIGEQRGVEHVRIFNKRGVIMFSAHEEEVHQVLDKEVAGCIECHAGDVPAVHLGPMDQARYFDNELGVPVIAITAAVYNEPSCYTGACHIHSADEQILGTLDIGMSQAPFLQSLATLRIRLIIFCLMVMVLTVGGVTALLRRNVLLPVRQLVYFADRVSEGDLRVQEPRGTEEVASLAANFRRLAEERLQGDAKREELQKKIDDLSRAIKEREQGNSSNRL